MTLCGRLGAKSAAPLLSLAQNQATDNKKAALQPLVAAGGSDALAAVAAATSDKDESLQDEAVQALCSWPDSWPEDGSVAEVTLVARHQSRRKEFSSSAGVAELFAFSPGR